MVIWGILRQFRCAESSTFHLKHLCRLPSCTVSQDRPFSRMNSPGQLPWRTLTDERAIMLPAPSGKRIDPPTAGKKTGSFLKRSRVQGSESAPIVHSLPSIETKLDISDPTWSDLAVARYRLHLVYKKYIKCYYPSWRIFQSCPERGSRCFLADLPLEVFSHLAGYLQVQDLLVLGSASKRLFVRCSSKQVTLHTLANLIADSVEC